MPSSPGQCTRVPAAPPDNPCRPTSASVFVAIHLPAWLCHLRSTRPTGHEQDRAARTVLRFDRGRRQRQRRSARLRGLYQRSRQRASLLHIRPHAFTDVARSHWGGNQQCHLRLATREHALLLLQRFERCVGEEREEITLELLDGRREEMYWECVPDKVRAHAVQRSQALEVRGDAVRTYDDEDPSREPGLRKRRRRR
jgi:hypothetical protein